MVPSIRPAACRKSIVYIGITYLSETGHEISVPSAGNDVYVQVILHAGARRRIEVEPDIKTVIHGSGDVDKRLDKPEYFAISF
jgi:hypothetical protein